MNYVYIKNTLKKNHIVMSGWKTIKRLIYTPEDIVCSRRAIKKMKAGEIKKASYYDLYRMRNDSDYNFYLREAHRQALNLIQKKIENGEKVKIAFQASFLATWTGDELLKYFIDDRRFDVTVVTAWQTNGSKEEIPPLNEHFKSMGVSWKFADGTVHPGNYDIVIYTAPYIGLLKDWGEKDIPLSTLVCHIPYGIYIAQIQQSQFNLFIHGINWKNYTTSKFYLMLADKYCRIRKYGMVYSGYPKLDNAYNPKCGEEAEWKIVKENDVKKIIYAPHHSLMGGAVSYSTFASNKDYMLQYAREHAATTSWVYKPHPLLRISSVKSGIFPSEAEYDAYVDEWRSLPNAIVAEGGYLPYMASSDAMILDSVSFLAEYMYFNKPLLFLTRKSQTVNEFGEQIKDVLYQTPGENLEGIRHFLEKTIYEDSKRREREKFFSEYLDYYRDNGKLASEFIYSDIVKSLGMKVEN